MEDDRGLQPERTVLAWRRTSLAFAGGSAIAARLLFDELLVAAVAIGLVGIVLSLAAFVAAGAHHRRMLHGPRPAARLDGGALHVALMASAALVLGLAGALYVLVGAATHGS